VPLVGLLSFFARERRVRIDHALELSSAYRGTALLLGDVVEADDAYTGSHSRHVVDLVLATCDRLRLSPQDRRDAEFVALLHDVGKIRIPNEIINKPGPLTPEERAIVETHTVVGEEMLDRVGGVLGNVGHLVRSCHERFGGGGYPDGLVGDEIPLVARIVCCCDAYSAITTDRPYRAGRSAEEALEELRRCAGTQFDPDVVDALARVAANPS
jgi:HD-GYP domain-containing protein (c-di-GMP phosphodiesterase class II)